MKHLTRAALLAAGFLALAAPAQAVSLTASQAQASAQIASERWLGRPATRVHCIRQTRRRFACALYVHGPLNGPLGHQNCRRCVITTRLAGVIVTQARPHLAFVSLAKHWTIATRIRYTQTRATGVASGSG
jgi:hypothetical protein